MKPKGSEEAGEVGASGLVDPCPFCREHEVERVNVGSFLLGYVCPKMPKDRVLVVGSDLFEKIKRSIEMPARKLTEADLCGGVSPPVSPEPSITPAGHTPKNGEHE